ASPRKPSNRAPALVRAGQPPHREFDVAAGQLAPGLDRAHIAGLGVAGEEGLRPFPRRRARQREALAQIAVAGRWAGLAAYLAPARHPLGEIPRTIGHVLPSSSQYAPAQC